MKASNGSVNCSNCHSDPAVPSPATAFYVNTTHIASLYGSMPANVPVGATITVPITIKNRGSSTWNATGADAYALSYGIVWTDSNNVGHSVRDSSLRTPLPNDLPAGQEVG